MSGALVAHVVQFASDQPERVCSEPRAYCWMSNHQTMYAERRYHDVTVVVSWYWEACEASFLDIQMILRIRTCVVVWSPTAHLLGGDGRQPPVGAEDSFQAVAGALAPLAHDHEHGSLEWPP